VPYTECAAAAGPRIAVIGTILAAHARIRLRCIGGKRRRSAAVAEVVGESRGHDSLH
jgi:hypothetical protein